MTLRKESLQFFKVVRWTSGYMFFLTIIYFVQSMICWAYLDPQEFQKHIKNGQYGHEIYEYSLTIEKLKIVHALSLGSVAFFVLLFTRRFKMLNEKHYA